MPAARRRPRQAIPTAESLYFQLLVLTNLTGRPFAAQHGARLGLQVSEWRVMLVIADRPGITAQALAEYSGLDKMSVSRAVRALAVRGYVARRAAAGDRRRLELSLTAAGERAYLSIVGSAKGREKALFAPLSGRDRAAFARLLARLIAGLRARDAG